PAGRAERVDPLLLLGADPLDDLAHRPAEATAASRRSRVTLRRFAALAHMNDNAKKISELLHEAGETHHTVYRITDGEDPDWASWYGDWLIRLSGLPQILGTTPVRSELVWLLVQLDKDYTAAGPDTPWPRWFAGRVIEHVK